MLVADFGGQVMAEVSIDAIPFRAVVGGDQAWITSDGNFEALSYVDLGSAALVEQFATGENRSTTTGPTTPILVGNDIWVPNRGDDVIYIVGRS